MEQRLYFIFGDILSNLSIGIISAIVCASMFSPESNMFFAMLIGMFVGMILSMVLGVGVFFRYFGAMEVMVPTSLTGMMAGMIISMWAAMAEISLTSAALLGAVIGVLCLGVTYWLQGKTTADTDITAT